MGNLDPCLRRKQLLGQSWDAPPKKRIDSRVGFPSCVRILLRRKDALLPDR